jgi:hypothetical protein
MNYPIVDEIIGTPSLKLDGIPENQINQVSYIISNITYIKLSKVEYFIVNFGLETILNNPSIMGITPDQEDIIKNLNDLILFGGETNGAINNVKSVRY